MFNIDKTVEYSQLKELIISIIGNKYYLDIIYPAPDSLPTSQTAWICIKNNINNINNIGKDIINKLNNTEINNKCVGVIFVKSYITPQKIMIRNLSDSVTKNDIIKLLETYGKIKDISMKENENNNEHSGWCFITFEYIKSAIKTICELNGYKLKNKIIAIDYTLPKDIYNTIQNKWKEYNKQNGIKNILNKKVNEPKKPWKLYSFMCDDYEEKTFYKKYIFKNKKNKVKTFIERLEIPISCERLDYDWLKYFLWRHRLNMIQYECNCKIEINILNNYINILSDNKHDLNKCLLIIKDILNNKKIREIGYTQIMNIPFELEQKDFDWKLYLNGNNFKNKKYFEFQTGCSFIILGKGKSMQIELAGGTKTSLQRGVEYMKNNIFDGDIKNQRDKIMGYKYIKRIYCPCIQLGKNKNKIKQIENKTHCQIRVFGSLIFQFENKKNTKSYYKIMAKNDNYLKNAIQFINQLIENDKNDMENNQNNNKQFQKRFWFYSGDANEGRTVFVRNLPFEINQKEIRDKFKEFGYIISVKMVFDKISGNPRGSAFIQYDNTQCVENILNNKNINITINGRKLIINRAVNKFEAKKIERSSRKNKDKRNLYLAKEGIMLQEKEMNEMDKNELDRRISQWKKKKIKLQNPNFHVSTTRLSIRNIPTFVNEKYLKKIFYNKAIEIRNKLEEKKKDEIFQYKFAKINQVKIVRDNIRVNKNGIGRSKRFGFIEFREHSDALLVLRELNNNICNNIFDFKYNKNINNKQALGRLTVEFAVQDMKKLHFHVEKVKKHKYKWRNANLEKLKDKLEILKAQKQNDQVQIVENKINVIQNDIDNSKLLEIQMKKKMLKMKKKNNFVQNKITKKFKHKNKNKGVKRG